MLEHSWRAGYEGHQIRIENHRWDAAGPTKSSVVQAASYQHCSQEMADKQLWSNEVEDTMLPQRIG
jgi:hypothetical protein